MELLKFGLSKSTMMKNFAAINLETRDCFWTAIFTSWISPCSVWFSTSHRRGFETRCNKRPSSNYFLFALSSGSLISTAMCVATCYLVAHFNDNETSRKFPIIHCFESASNGSVLCSLSINSSGRS